jgi:integrase
MSVYKQPGCKYYTAAFTYAGRRHQFSTRETNRREALTALEKRRTEVKDEHKTRAKAAAKLGVDAASLVHCTRCEKLFDQQDAVYGRDGKRFCGRTCLDEWEHDRVVVPTLREFKEDFMRSVETKSAAKQGTVGFYRGKYDRLLEFGPMADTRLDRIDEPLINSFVEHRRKVVGPATTNRELATLRKALRLAQEWRKIDRVPRIRLDLKAERGREFVVSDEMEQRYFSVAPQPLHDVGLLILDEGLRPSEALALAWKEVHLEPAPGRKLGWLHVRQGKSKNARRNLSLTTRVRTMLEGRMALRTNGAPSRARASDGWVFPDDDGKPFSRVELWKQHDAAREKLGMDGDFVVYSLRHTFGTRLGESGESAYTIMRLMGHSSVTISQKYVHPQDETLERAFKRLEARNQAARKSLKSGAPSRAFQAADGPRRQLSAINPAISGEGGEGED